mgnify:CR=1 FL=1
MEKGFVKMKKAARIIGQLLVSLVAAIYGVIAIGGIFEAGGLPPDIESLGIFILSLLTLVSAVLAWIKPRIGVWFVFSTGILFTIFALITAGSNQWMAVIFSGAPLIIGGFLILFTMPEKTPVQG